jgi:hypothetical protein
MFYIVWLSSRGRLVVFNIFLQVLNCAEDLLKTATQQIRLTVARINAGWVFLNALVQLGAYYFSYFVCLILKAWLYHAIVVVYGTYYLGAPVMKDHLPRLCQMWRAEFLRSAKEAEAEKARGA